MRRSSLRYVVAAIALLLLVGGLVAVKFTQISSLIAMGKQFQATGPPPEAVGTAVAQAETWETTCRRSAASPACAASRQQRGPGHVTQDPLRVGADRARRPGPRRARRRGRARAAGVGGRATRSGASERSSAPSVLAAGNAIQAQLDSSTRRTLSSDRRTTDAAALRAQIDTQDHPRAVSRPARHPRRQPRPVPDAGNHGDRARGDRRSSSTSRCRSRSWRRSTSACPCA